MGLAVYNSALMEVPLPLVLMQKLLAVDAHPKYSVTATLEHLEQLDVVNMTAFKAESHTCIIGHSTQSSPFARLHWRC